jgi:hypothetical protein
LVFISSWLVLISAFVSSWLAFISASRHAIICSVSEVWRYNDPMSSAQLFTQSHLF